MRFGSFSFGSLQIDAKVYECDLVIDQGEIRKRRKKPSKRFREDFGHTPLSLEEDIPWECRRLVIGTGAYGRLPVMRSVRTEAEIRNVELTILPTEEAIEVLNKDPKDTNAILHLRAKSSPQKPNKTILSPSRSAPTPSTFRTSGRCEAPLPHPFITCRSLTRKELPACAETNTVPKSGRRSRVGATETNCSFQLFSPGPALEDLAQTAPELGHRSKHSAAVRAEFRRTFKAR